MAHIDLNDDWSFTPVWTEAFGRGEPAENGSYETVRLPHTCREVPFNYFDESLYQMVCGYRRTIGAPKEWRGKRVLLHIGAAGHSAEVYLNGTFLKAHHCGYTAFAVELTAELNYEAVNCLAIKVNSREDQNIPPFGFVIDYMTYGGLYREVSLEIRESVYLENIFAKPYIREEGRHGPLYIDHMPQEPLDETAGNAGQIISEITLNGAFEIDGRELLFRQRLLPYPKSAEGEPLAVRSQTVDDCKTGMSTWHGEGHITRIMKLDVPEMSLWSLDSPTLYILRTELISVRAERPKTVLTQVHKALRGERDRYPASGSELSKAGVLREVEEVTLTGLLANDFDADEILLDVKDEVIGFRTIEFRKDGFYLNGRQVKLTGLNRHQSWPYVGYAMPASQQRLDADILKKELGLNAVRCSHYPQSQHFMRRCDEIGLLVFTEAPGWQHIGDLTWKEQGIRNVEDMVLQNRSHPSVFLWGTRINESVDDDDFYGKTAKCARALDPTRPVSGVRCYKKSHLIEDVYAYNDFSHDGTNAGCEKKKAVTSEMNKAYFISESNGHMFPTKVFDNENTRLEQALRHATVLDAAYGEPDIAGAFGWCLFDYNTHRDFGSGDRICYHGVLDMFRNPKIAASLYMSQQDEYPYLEVSSLMAMGEHPANLPGKMYVFSNADEVRFYRNDSLIGTLKADRERWPNLKHPPILIDQFVAEDIGAKEDFTTEQAADVRELLNYAAVCGFDALPLAVKAKAAKLMLKYRMTFEDAYRLFGTYVGTWGQAAVSYRFEAVKDGRTIKRLIRSAMTDLYLDAAADHTELVEDASYDVASVRLVMRDQNGAVMPFYLGSVRAEVTGPIEIIGPSTVQLRGGMGGLYVKTRRGMRGLDVTGSGLDMTDFGAEPSGGSAGAEAGRRAALTLKNDQAGTVVIPFTVRYLK